MVKITIQYMLVATFCLTFGAIASNSDLPDYVLNESIPDQIQNVVLDEKFSSIYAISSHINPFFINGDFNGDGKLDTAILIKEKSSGMFGIAIIHGGSNKISIVGAGNKFGNGGKNLDWMNAWTVHSKLLPVSQGATEMKPPKLLGDALIVMNTDAGSALIYWNGKKYVWYQQGD